MEAEAEAASETSLRKEIKLLRKDLLIEKRRSRDYKLRWKKVVGYMATIRTNCERVMDDWDECMKTD